MPVRLSWSIGEPLERYGFGEATDGDYNTYTDGLRSAVLHITESDANGDYGMARNSQNQELAVGDSGGPSMSPGCRPGARRHPPLRHHCANPESTWIHRQEHHGLNLPLSAPGRTVSVNDWILGVLGIRIDAAALWPQQVSVVPASWFDSSLVGHIPFQPGVYDVRARFPLYYAGGSNLIGRFTVQADGEHHLQPGLRADFGGAGTNALVLTGIPNRVYSTALLATALM